jgi:hypothetical protein
VFLVNARRTKNLPGRKTDVQGTGMSVATAIAHLWSPERLLPSTGGDLRPARLLAATGRTRGLGEHLHSEDAEGSHRDERAVGQRDQ